MIDDNDATKPPDAEPESASEPAREEPPRPDAPPEELPHLKYLLPDPERPPVRPVDRSSDQPPGRPIDRLPPRPPPRPGSVPPPLPPRPGSAPASAPPPLPLQPPSIFAAPSDPPPPWPPAPPPVSTPPDLQGPLSPPPHPARVALVGVIFTICAVALTWATWSAFLPEATRLRFNGPAAPADPSSNMSMQAKFAIGMRSLGDLAPKPPGASRDDAPHAPAKDANESADPRAKLTKSVLDEPDHGFMNAIAQKLIFCDYMDADTTCSKWIAELENAAAPPPPGAEPAPEPGAALTPEALEHNGKAERLRAAVLALYRDDAVPSGEDLALAREKLGVFGELAALRVARMTNDPGADALETKIKEDSRRFVLKLLGGSALVVVMMAVGLAALMWFLVGTLRGELNFKFIPGPRGSGFAFFEAFALYLAVMIALPLALRRLLPAKDGGPSILLGLNLVVDVSMLVFATWPVFSGRMDWARWRAMIGWNAGAGLLKEFGAALAGYLASLPLLALGFGVMILLRKLTGLEQDEAIHPIYPLLQKFRQNPALIALLVALAVVAAPLVEETFFRGAFYRALRTRFGWPVAAVLSAALFAGLHPQGLLGFPLLFSIGATLATLREWRGSLLAPMMAHAMNNGFTLLLALALM